MENKKVWNLISAGAVVLAVALFGAVYSMNKRAEETLDTAYKNGRKVVVYEVIEVDYRHSLFKAVDGRVYRADWGSYRPGDVMECRPFAVDTFRCRKQKRE